MADYNSALDAIRTRITAAWQADARDVLSAGADIPLLYEGSDRTDKPTNQADTTPKANMAWGRMTVRHNDGQRRTLGKRARYERTGIVYVQCFFPNVDDKSNINAMKLAQVASRSIEGMRQNGVVFSRVRNQEKGVDGAWYRVDMQANFSWDEFRG